MLYVWQNYIIKNWEAERERWFLWMPVLFGSGIGLYFLLPSEPSMWLTLAVIEAIILAAYLGRHHSGFLFVLAALSVVVLGFTDIQLKSIYLSETETLSAERKLYLRGRVEAVGTNYRGNPRFVLADMYDFDDRQVPGRYRISLVSKSSEVKTGDCVELIAQVSPLPKPAMPGAYQLDRKGYFEGLNAYGFAASRALPLACDPKASAGLWFKMLIDKLRKTVVQRINKVLPPDEAGIAAAIVAGERGGIKNKITENYRDSGLAHFLSISGLHMSMIAGIMFFLVRITAAMIPAIGGRCDAKKIAAVFAIFMSLVYLLISGAEIPSQRAFIMTFIVLLGVIFARQAISMRMIAWAALIVLAISPQALVGASFQMSFAAVAALIAFYEANAGRLYRFLNGTGEQDISLPLRIIKIVWVYLLGIIISDLVASLATLPFAVYHFNRIAVFTSLTNLLAGPIIGFVIMPFVLLALLLMPLGLDYWPLKLVGLGISWVNDITSYVAGLPAAAYKVVSLPLWGLLLIVYGGLWLCLWRQRWRLWGLAAIMIGFAAVLTVRVPDVMADREGKVFAVKDETGKMVILPTRGNYYLKKVWLEKTANDKLTPQQTKRLKGIYDGKLTDQKWIDMVCDKSSCLYKNVVRLIKAGGIEVNGKAFDLNAGEGANFYLNKGGISAETVRDKIGYRFWN